jgi:methyl-accepting chemotaxis protein
MQFILDWFLGSTQMITALQVSLDLLVIALVAYHVTKPAKKPEGAEKLLESLQQVIDETRRISEAFDRNLQERRELIQGLLKSLDQQVRDAEGVCRKLTHLTRSLDDASCSQASTFASLESQDILRLARSGMDATAIADKLRKPIGEVELILSLARISPG